MIIAGRLPLNLPKARDRSLFRTLHKLEGRLTSRRTLPTCVILSSGMLRLLYVSHPAAVRRFNSVDNVNRCGGGGCKGSFMGLVQRFI